MIKSFSQRGSPLLALSNPEKIKMTGDEMNMDGWLLCCTDKSLSSSAGSAIPPRSRAPCIPPAPRGSAQPMRAACTARRRNVRRKERSQQPHHRGFGTPRRCSCKLDANVQRCSPLCGGFPLSAPCSEKRGGTDGPAEKSDGLSCKCNRHL